MGLETEVEFGGCHRGCSCTTSSIIQFNQTQVQQHDDGEGGNDDDDEKINQ